MKNIALVAEYFRIIEVKRIGLFYRVCDDPAVTVLDGGDIFPISFTPLSIWLNVGLLFLSLYVLIFCYCLLPEQMY